MGGLGLGLFMSAEHEHEHEEETLTFHNAIKLLGACLAIIVVVVGPIGTWFVMNFRVDTIEDDRREEKSEFKEWRKGVDLNLSQPRFTLEDYSARQAAKKLDDLSQSRKHAGEIQRLRDRVDAQDEFRLVMVRATTDQSATAREMMKILVKVQSDVEELKKRD